MEPFAPIAIVGQGCALPGALSPEALWSLIASGRSAIGPLPPGTWRLPPGIDRAELDREAGSPLGGYVEGFERVFDPGAFEIPTAGLDPVFLWTMHAARQALDSAGIGRGARHPRGRVILGNLSYPTPALVDLAVETWEGAPATDPRNRFMSGLPALLTAQAVGFELGGFSLDAACASSLYAIKYACDALHDRTADLVIAGGVNHAESLFLHLGFTALAAASPTGRSRPFHREADGLVAAEGAAVVLLERLEDALAHGRRVLGVIRGAGLSNDGRGRGLLVPVEAGQQRAMREAYARSGLAPEDVSLVECHATGTAVGDATEVRSMRAVFTDARDLPIGSLKGNLGHLITASGAAALLKVLGAFAARARPATLHAEAPIDELAGSGLRLLQAAEPWPAPGGEPRRAAISNFGFGGNNAHLIVEEWSPGATHAAPPPRRALDSRPIAIVAQAVTTGSWTGPGAFARALFEDTTAVATDESLGRAPDFALDIGRFRYPPTDLKAALAQQTLFLSTAVELDAVLAKLPAQRTGLFVGMQCDAEIARSSLRWRRPGALAGASTDGPLTAPLILGCMPNIVANRLGSQLDFTRETFTVSAEEASGNVALELALRALRSGDLDAAVAGAVDLCCEPVHATAAARVLPSGRPPADAAVLLVLKRLADAERDGDPIVAVLDDPADAGSAPGLELALGPTESGLTPLIGHAHAASGLLHVAAAAASCAAHALPRSAGRPAMPFLPERGRRRARVAVEALGGGRVVVNLASAERARPSVRTDGTRLVVFGADDLAGLRHAIERDIASEPQLRALRLAIVADGDAELAERTARAIRLLAGRSDAPRGVEHLDEGIYLGGGAPIGEVGFVFTGPAGAYSGMGRELALALPDLVDNLGDRMASLREAAGWLYERGADYRATPVEKLWGSSFLIQLHAELTRGLLGIRAHASIGYCSGETNALFALGAWSDLDGFRRVIDSHAVYERELSGELRCVRRAWGVASEEPVGWASLRVRAPIDELRRVLETEPKVHLTIVNTRTDLVIAGDPDGCARVAERIGKHRVRSLDYDFVMHCPEARGYRAEWRAIHHRPTVAVPDVRFYTHATLASYTPTADAVADALTGQAMNLVDFPAMIERAFADGVRIFVEHGPHAGCTKWIGEILGDRPHLAVALDRYGESSLNVVASAVAQLIAAGVPMDHGRLSALLRPPGRPRASSPPRPSLMLAAHLDPVRLPRIADEAPPPDGPVEVMVPAPILPLEAPAAARAVAPPTSPLAAHQEKLAALHAAYLRQQAANHARFLEVVLGGGASVGAPAFPAVSPPPPPPAPLSPPSHGAPLDPPRPRRPGDHPARRSVRGPRPPTGPRFGRAELEILASGTISSVFGPRFEGQDRYARQVRMPEPPLLLADRVLGIEGEAGSMGLGTIWTETDIASDAWYLHEGRMPAGILVESGQADLLLISWLGIDALNRGERVYRLLGCELTSHGELPRAGDTLTYEITVDGHANQGEVRLFFFHYDCWVNGELRVTVRNGQAGFFTDEELRASAGILWRAEEAKPSPDARLDPPVVRCEKRSFSSSDIDALARGDGFACFGPGFERLASHTRTPSIQGDRMRLLDEVSVFDPAGGPWRRGYLQARLALTPDHWFFPGHFKNDPCMPGTLMFEGCLQALAIYLAALGFTIDRDGWRFEPVSEVMYPLRCRGQALPSSKEVVYEVFVDEIVGGAEPTIYADLLGSVDGLKAFHCRRMGLRLVPAWPLDAGRLALPSAPEGNAAEALGFRFDHRSLLACALGRPSEAFGALYAPFDGVRRAPRLPGPPYHFMSRIARVDGPIGGMQVGSAVEAVYDVPPDAWYFDQAARRVMPYAVLLEVALQPCGWLASYIGCASASPTDLVFRNLDGTGTVHREVPADIGSLVTTARLTSLSTAGGLIIVGFDVAVRAHGTAGAEVYTFTTVFGFFPPEAMTQQIGLPVTPELRAELAEPSEARVVDLARGEDRARWLDHALRLPAPMLRMIDRITGLWPDGGKAGLGRIRAEKDVDPGEWFFKAHFFQDPVQPGSLGLEAMIQTLQAFVIAEAPDRTLDETTFEPIASDVAMTWKYRGQVVPEAKRVTVDLELTALTDDPRGRLTVASGSLWVDGKRIYEVSGLGVRTVARPAQLGVGLSSSPPMSPRDADLRTTLKAFWRSATEMRAGWAGEDLLFALLDRFVGEIHVATPPILDRRGALYVANHQVAAETILAALVIGGLRGTIPSLPAKAEHRRTWVGELVRLLMARPGVRDPHLLRFVDRDDPTAMLRYLKEELAAELRGGRSALVHVEGTRATSARHRVATISSVFLDLAIETGVDVVPLRFTGGLPIAPVAERLELPVGYGKQAYWFGRPIPAAELARLPLAARSQRVLAAISELGPSPEAECPAAPDAAFAEAVRAFRERHDVGEPQAAMAVALAELADPSDEGRALLAALRAEGDGPDSEFVRAIARWLRGGR